MSGTSRAIFFSTGTSTGNDNNTIQNCNIRDRSDVSGVPTNLIYSSDTSVTVSNSNNSILNNKFLILLQLEFIYQQPGMIIGLLQEMKSTRLLLVPLL